MRPCASTSSPTTSGTPSAGTSRARALRQVPRALRVPTSSACRSCGRSRAIFLDEVLPGHNRVQDGFVGWTTREQHLLARLDVLRDRARRRGRGDQGCRTPARCSGCGCSVEDARPLDARRDRAPHAPAPSRRERDGPVAARRRDAPHHRGAEAAQPQARAALLHGRLQRSGASAEPAARGGLRELASPRSGSQPPPTFKCYPTADVDARQARDQPVRRLDRRERRRARRSRRRCRISIFNDAAPSDHWPVQAVYELRCE